MPTILIADDDEMIRLLIREMLSRADSGYGFVEAGDGTAALALAQASNPDLILLDLLMPGMNGLEVCRALKEAEETRHIPIIMVTSQDQRTFKAQAVAAGGDDFLVKPFDSFELTLRVRSLLRIKQMYDALQDRYAESRDRNEELQLLGEWREDLTHMVIHDMRAPLSNAQLALQFVLGEGPLDPLQRKTLELASSSIGQLVKMVNNILDISRMERGKLILDKRPQDVPALIERALQGLSALAEVDGKTFEVVVAEVLPRVSADGDLLLRVISNLLDNALRYSPRGSPIAVAVREQTGGAGLEVSVHSHGDPIPVGAREAIFAKFRQLGQARSRKGGLGLGLAFCRMAVEAHGGRIWVEGDASGNTFKFVLPITPDLPGT